MIRILRLIGMVVALLALLLLARFVHLSMTAQPPDTLGSASGLAPCPKSPNCVSSRAERESQRIDPLRVEGDAAQATAQAIAAIEAMPRARVVAFDGGYVHAEFSSALFRFIDDLELVHDPALPGFQVRSASRVGRSDLGANRKRVEALRSLLASD